MVKRKKKDYSKLSNFKLASTADYILCELARKQRRTKTAVIEELLEREGKRKKIEYPAQVAPGTLVEG